MGEQIAIKFLKMDGLKGLLFVAEKIGALLLEKPDEVDFGYLISQSLEICGEQPTWDALRDTGATNPIIEKFRLAVAADHLKWCEPFKWPPKVALLTYEQLFQKIPLNSRHLFWKWGEQASEEELALAANGLIAAKDAKEQLAHLRIFADRRFPLDVNVLLAFIDSEEQYVGHAAAQALAHVSHPSVRSLAFRLVETRREVRRWAIDLIAENFETGDHEVVLRWFQEETDADASHWMGSDLIHFWERHPREETEVPMLRSLYEKQPCSFCREKVVKHLLNRNALTDELREECRWDANADIRELVSG